MREAFDLAFFFSCLLAPFILLLRGGARSGVRASLGTLTLWIAVGWLGTRLGFVLTGAPASDAIIVLSCVAALLLSLGRLARQGTPR